MHFAIFVRPFQILELRPVPAVIIDGDDSNSGKQIIASIDEISDDEGWEPVKAVDHPEITMVTTENEKFADNVVIGGLMLCKAPKELAEERSEYYQSQTDNQMQSVDNNFMRENDPRMPLFNERKTKVTFGKGT